MKRRVSRIIAGVALGAGAGLAVPTTAGALADPSGEGLPVVYEASVTPEVAQFVYDTGAAAAVAEFGFGLPDPNVGWLIGGNAEMLDVVSYDVAVLDRECGEIGMRGTWYTPGQREIVGASYEYC